MIGILLYIFFLVTGFLYADEIFKNKDIYFRLWMGGVFGNVLMMAGMIPCGIIFGFSIIAHIVLAILSIIPYIVIKLKKREKPNISLHGGEEWMTHKIFLCVILPIAIITWVLMTNHILMPYKSGGVSSGQSTYGDLQMHLSFVTSIAEQGKFPPQYCLLSGYNMNYPFLVDMLSSSLYLFGTPLRGAVLVPSYVIALLLIMGFYIVAYKLTKRKSAAVIATVLFFINGGLGFAYFIDGAKADPTLFTRIFKDYYHTPTNYVDSNIRWVNTICDMIIPQRTTMAGWCVLMPCIWLLSEAVITNKRKIFVILGIIAGCMPMIHTHSLLALGIMSAVMFFAYFSKKDMKNYITNWIIYGAIVFVMAFPQLLYWTLRQTSGNETFLRFSFNWANKNDNYFWFYLKNWGITALLLIPAVMNADKDNKKIFMSSAVIMLIAEFIIFQPNEYDNNKLIFITYMISVILVSDFCVFAYNKMVALKIKGMTVLAATVILSGTLSGALTICREYVSGGEYQTFGDDDITFAEYVRKNTDKNSVFLTGDEITNPITVFAGRNIYLGSSSYVYFHGFAKEVSVRRDKAEKAYTGTYENMKEFCEKNNISYIYIGASEESKYQINKDMLSKLKKVYANGRNSLYKVE